MLARYPSQTPFYSLRRLPLRKLSAQQKTRKTIFGRNNFNLFPSGLYHRLWNLARSANTKFTYLLAGFSPKPIGWFGARLHATAGQEFLPIGSRSPCPKD